MRQARGASEDDANVLTDGICTDFLVPKTSFGKVGGASDSDAKAQERAGRSAAGHVLCVQSCQDVTGLILFCFCCRIEQWSATAAALMMRDRNCCGSIRHFSPSTRKHPSSRLARSDHRRNPGGPSVAALLGTLSNAPEPSLLNAPSCAGDLSDETAVRFKILCSRRIEAMKKSPTLTVLMT